MCLVGIHAALSVVHMVFDYLTMLCIRLGLIQKDKAENSEMDLRERTFILPQVQQKKKSEAGCVCTEGSEIPF